MLRPCWRKRVPGGVLRGFIAPPCFHSSLCSLLYALCLSLDDGLSASCSDTASLPFLTLPLNHQPKEILLEVALVMALYHSNRKVTNPPGNERTPLAARNTTKVFELTFDQHEKDACKIDPEA